MDAVVLGGVLGGAGRAGEAPAGVEELAEIQRELFAARDAVNRTGVNPNQGRDSAQQHRPPDAARTTPRAGHAGRGDPRRGVARRARAGGVVGFLALPLIRSRQVALPVVKHRWPPLEPRV